MQLDVYVGMLRDLGMDDAATELAAEADFTAYPSSPVYSPGSPTLEVPLPYEPPEVPYLAYEAPQYLPSFVQLTHIQPGRGFSPYKRLVHLQHHLDQLMGVGTSTKIALDTLKVIRKARINPKTPFAYQRSRLAIKRAGLGSPGYRKIFWALREMGGYQIKLTGNQEKNIKEDFLRLTEAFDRMKQRKNFPSYYVMIQLLFSKWGVDCFYKLPTIKDSKKYEKLLGMYRELRFSNTQV